jgi:CRISPR-associated endonuclease Csy4
MKFYIDIIILPSEIGHHFIWEKLFQQIHLGLVEMQAASNTIPVGIALPEYDVEKNLLGSRLRILAETENLLEQFNVHKWLSRLKDYVKITSIKTVPAEVKSYSCYRRQQIKTNIDRMARRKAKRQGISIEQAINDFTNFKIKLVKTPFINMKSQSTGKRFRLFIEKSEVGVAVNKGFSCYGLSAESTVPNF